MQKDSDKMEDDYQETFSLASKKDSFGITVALVVHRTVNWAGPARSSYVDPKLFGPSFM